MPENNSTVHLLGNAGQVETHNSSDRGEWIREPRPVPPHLRPHECQWEPIGTDWKERCTICEAERVMSVAAALNLRVMQDQAAAAAIPLPEPPEPPPRFVPPVIRELHGRVEVLEQRLGSATDQVVCCHTRFGAPCTRWTTRVNAEANWAYVGACYYCPQCWGHICAGR